MNVLRYIAGSIFLLAGLLLIFTNYARQITNFRNKNRENYQWSSPVPLIGPFFVILGYYALPIAFSKLIFWIIVFDPDTVIILLSIPILIKSLLNQTFRH